MADPNVSTITDRVSAFVDGHLKRIIRENNLQPCVFVVIFCAAHDCLRLISRRAPTGKQVHCPACGALSNCLILGKGGTRKPLPFWTVPGGEHV